MIITSSDFDDILEPDVSDLIREAHGAITAVLVYLGTSTVPLDDMDEAYANAIGDLAESLCAMVQYKRPLERPLWLCSAHRQIDGQFYLCCGDEGHQNWHESRGYTWI